MRRQAIGRDHASPGHHAGEARRIVAEQARTHRRMHPIGPDHEVRPRPAPVGEAQGDAAGVLFELYELGAQHDGVRLRRVDRLGQDPVQVMPVQGEVGEAVHPDRYGAGVEGLPGLAGVPQADDLLGGDDGGLHHRRFEAEIEQHAGPIGAELHARTDFGELLRLLVDGDLEAAADQREGASQAAEAGAHDGDASEHHVGGSRARRHKAPRGGLREPGRTSI